jgi:hypothetical protein
VSRRKSDLRRHGCIVTASADQTARIWGRGRDDDGPPPGSPTEAGYHFDGRPQRPSGRRIRSRCTGLVSALIRHRMFNLRGFDLNLLTVFEAIYEAGSVSRAAERLALSRTALQEWQA